MIIKTTTNFDFSSCLELSVSVISQASQLLVSMLIFTFVSLNPKHKPNRFVHLALGFRGYCLLHSIVTVIALI